MYKEIHISKLINRNTSYYNVVTNQEDYINIQKFSVYQMLQDYLKHNLQY